MANWTETTVGENAVINRSSIGRSYRHDEIVYLDTGSVTQGRVEALQPLCLSQAPSRAKRLVRDKDIVYSLVRPIQRHYGFIDNPPENLVVSTGFAVITAIPERVDPKFLYYYLTSDDVVNYLDTVAEGSTSAYPSLTPDVIADLEIALPPIDEQRAIAEVLSSLDDKIDLLHRQNKSLESLAQTLFRQWFIDAAQDDWQSFTVRDICEVISKGTTPTSVGHQFSDEGINFVKVETLSEDGSLLEEKLSFIDETAHDALKRSKLREGDVLITIAGTIGRVAVLPEWIAPANTNQAVAFLRLPNESRVSPWFLYCLLRSPEVREDFLSRIVHSVQANLSLGEIGSIEFAMPPGDVLSDAQSQLISLFEKKMSNERQTRTLRKSRDSLLPKLMSGEVQIRND